MFFHELARLVTAALFAAMLRLTLFLARVRAAFNPAALCFALCLRIFSFNV